MGTTWSVTSDIGSSEASEWGVTEDPISAAELHAWTTKATVLSSNANKNVGLMNFGGWAAEEFAETPEDVNVAPEVIQADQEEWTLRPEPI